MELEKRLLCLEKVLSTLPDHKGWMIGKCRFTLAKNARDNDAYTLEILRENQHLSEVRIQSGENGDRLDVTLIKPAKKQKKLPGQPESAEGRQEEKKKIGEETKMAEELPRQQEFLITREETDTYLEVSGDQNPIHRGEHAIAPGFLMANRIIRMFEMPETVQVRFLAPLPVGESADLIIWEKSGREQTAEVQKENAKILKIQILEEE